ncbi:MAG: SLBB domain-containing protein [candidate division WOR-3 bacterium]|nr:SLBB domain-containing protein [candidate division WOR-3 bacterium]
MKKMISVLMIMVMLSPYVFAQIETTGNYLSPEEQNLLMIRVNIWGQVRQSGSKIVPDGTKLITAMSFAGGPVDGANLNKVIVMRENGERMICDIGKYKKHNDTSHNPVLKPGDTVIVPSNFWVGFKEGVSFIYRVAVVFYTVFQIYDLANTYLIE